MTLWGENIYDIRVWLGFASPFVEPSGWNTIQDRVTNLSITRGRSSEFSRFGPGTATITLNNHDRRFDPTYEAGLYYSTDPNTGLGLNNHIKIELVHGEVGGVQTSTVIYRGYVAGWPQSYEAANKQSTVTIQCFDLLGMLGRVKAAESAFVQYMENTVTEYIPMQEQEVEMGGYFHEVSNPSSRTGGWYADDKPFSSDTHASLTNKPTAPAGASTYWGDAVTLLGFGNDDNQDGFRPYSFHELGFWFVGTTSSDAIEVHVAGTIENGYITIAPSGVDDDGIIKFHMYDYATGFSTLNYPTATQETTLATVDGLFDGRGKHVYFRRSATPNLSVYVNGILRNTVAYSTVHTGNVAVLLTNCYVGLNAFVSHFSIGGDDPALMATIGNGEELTDAKSMIEEAMLYGGVDPTTWLVAEDGQEVLRGLNPEGAFLANYLADVASSEQGSVFCNRIGKITFLNRDTVVSPGIKLYVGDGLDVTSIHAVSAMFSDPVVLRNEVTGSWLGGSVEAQDNDSIEKYGTYSANLALPYAAYEGVAQSAAERHVARYAEPQDRVTQLEIVLGDRSMDADAIKKMAEIDLGQGAVVVYDPVRSNENLWRALRVEGINWNITPSTCKLRLVTSSITNVNGPLLILNHPTYGQIGSTNVLG